MVEKSELEDNERPYSWWPRVVAMFTAIALVAIVFTLVTIFNTAAIMKPELPHIVFILADDLGWNDVSFHGSPQIPTPNIDALAASGVILNNYYTHPQCTPSRGALMSGKYANRLGLHHGDIKPAEASGLPLNVATLPEYMKKMGYRTHMVGKWHLGYHKKRYFPTRRGFDSFFGFMNDNIDYYDYTCYYQATTKENADPNDDSSPSVSSEGETKPGNVKELFGIDIYENEEVLRDFRGEYATKVFTDKAIGIIEEHNTTKPLFLFISHAASRSGNDFFPFQTPADLFEQNNHIKDTKRRSYAGMVDALDQSVGSIFEALYAKKILRNTIIVLSSDNGGMADPGSGSNWPLRGTKSTLWEGGVRSVALVWSSLFNLTKPRISMELMHISDWLPTFYFAAGGDVDELGDIDGVNMWPVMLSDAVRSPRQEVLLNVDPIAGVGSLRIGDMKILTSEAKLAGSDWYGPSGLEEKNVTTSMNEWVWKNGSSIKYLLEKKDKWLLSENDTWRQDAVIFCGENFLPVSGKCDFTNGPCLYNITDDPCEFKNIASLYPEIVNEMLERLRDFNATSLPTQSKEIDPLGDPICHDFAHVPWLDDD